MPRVGICLMLAFIMLIGPEGLQQASQAQTLYSNILISTWAQPGTTTTYTYYDDGSVKSKVTTGTSSETISYDYDVAGRLCKVTKNGIETFYTYDYNGSRIEMRNGSTTTEYLIDAYNPTGYSQTLEERAQTGTSATSIWYTIGDDVISQAKSHWTLSGGTRQLQSTDATQFLIYDGHGSTRQLVHYVPAQGETSASIAVDDTYGYDAYGVMLGGNPTSIPANGTSLLYSGEQFDTDLSQYNLRARWYDQNSGRFTQLDPYAGNTQDPQSLHKYLYCHANPVNGVDPSGKDLIGFTVAAFTWVMLNAFTIAHYATIVALATATVYVACGLAISVDDLYFGGRHLDALYALQDASGIAFFIAVMVADAGMSVGLVPSGSTRSSSPTHVKTIYVSKTKYPQSAAHVEAAQKSGKPCVLTVDRSGTIQRRAQALKNIPRVYGSDRDEYPPAVFSEGGLSSSVRHIDPGDNRGAGSSIGNQLRGVKDGDTIKLEVN